MQNISQGFTKQRRQRGFTLVEIMVVVVIIGILGALVVPKLLGRTGESRVTAARTDIATLMQALKLYKLDNQRYPTTEQGLQALSRSRPAARPPTAGKRAATSKSCRRTHGVMPTSTCRPACMARSTSSRWARTASPAAPARMPTSVPGTASKTADKERTIR
jgi:prepilin-type N-terminal cleavage/methylation domain-containing protein